jgi:hypothetical protein
MGRPVDRADWRCRLEPIRERIDGMQSFVYRFESGCARRVAAPIDTGTALCLGVLVTLCV